MSLFRKIGREVKGLLGNEQFFDRLARAQAFAQGDYRGAHAISAALRKHEEAKAAAKEGGAAETPGRPVDGHSPSRLPHLLMPTHGSSLQQPRFHIPPGLWGSSFADLFDLQPEPWQNGMTGRSAGFDAPFMNRR